MEQHSSVGDTQSPLAHLMIIRSIFRKHFGDIEDLSAPDEDDANDPSSTAKKSKGKRGAAPRAPASRVLFALCATVVDHPELIGKELWDADIWKYLFNSPLSTARQHCDGCLEALERVELAKHVYKKIEKKQTKHDTEAEKTQSTKRRYYTINVQFMNRVLAFTSDIVRQLTRAEVGLTNDQQIAAARCIFDYLQHKYLSEWSLLIKKVQRTQHFSSEEQKEKAIILLHSDPNTWVLVHQYIMWLENDYTTERPWLPLVERIADYMVSEYDFAKAHIFLKCLSSEKHGVRLFDMNKKNLTPSEQLEEPIRVYVSDVHRKYETFVSVLRSFALDIQQNAPTQNVGAGIISTPVPI